MSIDQSLIAVPPRDQLLLTWDFDSRVLMNIGGRPKVSDFGSRCEHVQAVTSGSNWLTFLSWPGCYISLQVTKLWPIERVPEHILMSMINRFVERAKAATSSINGGAIKIFLRYKSFWEEKTLWFCSTHTYMWEGETGDPIKSPEGSSRVYLRVWFDICC